MGISKFMIQLIHQQLKQSTICNVFRNMSQLTKASFHITPSSFVLFVSHSLQTGYFADFFSKFTFLKRYSFNLDQAQHFVGPNLGPNCLQKLLADDTSR